MKADSPACVLKKKYHMTYGICEEAVYHVYCKTRLASRSNFIVFRIFKIGFQLGSTFDPVLFDGTVRIVWITASGREPGSVHTYCSRWFAGDR